MITLAEPKDDHKHCTHLCGKRKKPLHGKYAPKGTMMAGVWICCFCGEYSDLNGLPVDVSDIVLDKELA